MTRDSPVRIASRASGDVDRIGQKGPLADPVRIGRPLGHRMELPQKSMTTSGDKGSGGDRCSIRCRRRTTNAHRQPQQIERAAPLPAQGSAVSVPDFRFGLLHGLSLRRPVVRVPGGRRITSAMAYRPQLPRPPVVATSVARPRHQNATTTQFAAAGEDPYLEPWAAQALLPPRAGACLVPRQHLTEATLVTMAAVVAISLSRPIFSPSG